MRTQIDFSHAFGFPHRLTVCLPTDGFKLLADVSADQIALSWSDGDLAHVPFGAFAWPRIDWTINVSATENGEPMKTTAYRRYQNRYPALECTLSGNLALIHTFTAPCRDAMAMRITAENTGNEPVELDISALSKQFCFNLLWMDDDARYNAILPHMHERADRVLAFCVGGDDIKPKKVRQARMGMTLKPGEKRVSYLVIPRKITFDALEEWTSRDWDAEIEWGLSKWKAIFDRTNKIELPDKMVEDAFYACFADIFVMRERAIEGYTAGVAGSEMYRATNTVEPTIASLVLASFGFLDISSEMVDILMLFQEPDGRWDDVRVWGHHILWTQMYRMRFYIRYFELTGDKSALKIPMERMAAHCRYIKSIRNKTKITDENGEKVLYYGMLPRSMGDGGLMDGDDYFGHFFMASVAHCQTLKDVIYAANVLNQPEIVAEMKEELDDLWTCTYEAMQRGSIEEDGYRWIPAVPGKTSGSRFGAVLPFMEGIDLMSPFDSLAEGTMRHLTRTRSEGGVPVDLGWMKGGLWVAMALDQIARGHIARGEIDEAAAYLPITLNHGTPLFTWCEERMPEPGATKITGDIQHTFTPNAFMQFIRDGLVSEKGNVLHIARMLPREWMADGERIHIENIRTDFGDVSYTIERKGSTLFFDFTVKPGHTPIKSVFLHVRTPDKVTPKLSGAKPEGDGLLIPVTGNTLHAEISLT